MITCSEHSTHPVSDFSWCRDRGPDGQGDARPYAGVDAGRPAPARGRRARPGRHRADAACLRRQHRGVVGLPPADRRVRPEHGLAAGATNGVTPTLAHSRTRLSPCDSVHGSTLMLDCRTLRVVMRRCCAGTIHNDRRDWATRQAPGKPHQRVVPGHRPFGGTL